MSNFFMQSGRGAARFLYSNLLRQPCCLFRRALASESSSAFAQPPGPILTFLSPNPAYSRSAVQFLNELFHLPRITRGSESARDGLDQMHFGSNSSSWDSAACVCPASGTILHFLSISSDKSEAHVDNRNNNSPLHLISVHGPHTSLSSSSQLSSEEHYQLALAECRKLLADGINKRQIFAQPDDTNKSSMISSVESRIRGMLFYFMCNVIGRQPNPSWILGKSPTTSCPISPILNLKQLPSGDSKSPESGSKIGSNGQASVITHHENTGKLRELALPFYPEVSALQIKLSQSALYRPLPGLYQCLVNPEQEANTTKSRTANDPGLIFRPLPAADEDLRLSSPSLVFQCQSLKEAQELIEGKLGGSTFKIGWRGHGKIGSLMVNHPSLLGLDIRISEAVGKEWILSSSFDEAQESLLAGSLSELQNTHVVSDGKGDGAEASIAEDTKVNNGDCWHEFRTNAKHPSGFFKQLTASLLRKPAKTRVAKPPDIPYE